MGGLPIRSEKRLPLANLEPKELEDLCAAVLAAGGHDVRHWGDAGAERGVDLWSVDAGGRRWATQCKRTRVGPEDAEKEVRKVLEALPDPPPDVYLLASSAAISRATEQRLVETVSGRFEIVCWGFSELDRRLLRRPELIRRFFGDPWVPRRLAVAAGWQDREWAAAFRDDLAATLPAAGWTVEAAVPAERDALVEIPDAADGVLFAVTAEALADRRLLDPWQSAVLPSVRDGRRRGVALALDGAPWPPCFDVCERVELPADAGAFGEALARLAEKLSGEERTAPERPASPAKLPRRLPEEIRGRLVEWLAPAMEDALARQVLSVALGLGHLEALDPFPTPQTRASAAIVRATADDEPVQGALRVVAVVEEKLAEKEGTDRLASLRAIAEELKALRPSAGGEEDAGLLAAWFQRIRNEHERLVPFFQRAHELELLDRVYVELSLAPEERLRALGEVEGEGERARRAGYRLRDLLALEREQVPGVTGRWVVRGDPGAGKTTLLRHLAADLARQEHPPWVPVFQSLPVLLRSGKPLLDRVEEGMALAGRRGLRTVLEREGQTGRLLVLLDGLDEVGDRRAEAETMIRDLAERWPASRIVVATRPIGYRHFAADFREVELLPLDAESRQRFLARWFGRADGTEDPERAAAALAELAAPGLDHLAGNPLYLTLMAMLIEDGKPPKRKPSELYDQVFALLLEAKHKKRGEVEPIERPALVHRVLRRLAYAMTVDNRDAEPRPELEDRLYHPDLDDLYRELLRVPRWKKSFHTFLDDLAEKVGILADHDGEGADWRFWHRTFREALAAERLEEKLGAKGGEAALFAEAKRIAEKDDLSRWAEPYALLSGRVKDPDGLVRALVRENRALGLRALATAPSLRDDTLREVLELNEEREQWEERSKVYERIPDLVDEPMRALALVDQLRRRTRNGNDLFFLEQAVIAVGERWPDAGSAVKRQLDDLFNHVPPPPEDLFRRIETPRDGRVELWRPIAAGSFLVGSPEDEKGRHDHEGPRHEVVMSGGFRMAAVPVTVAQYAAFDPEHVSHFRGRVSDDELKMHPVDSVTWYEAHAFCRWLSAALPWARGARLPTEEEWEYACRAGTTTRYWSGDHEDDLARVGWYGQSSGGRTHRVGEKPANPWKLYDVHGNVWEWTLSEWDDQAYEKRKDGFETDPAKTETAAAAASASRGGERVIRGGSFAFSADWARSAYRDWGLPGSGFRGLGFRVLLPRP